MTKTAQRIADLAEKLSPEAQTSLLDMAESLAQPASFYAMMTPAQRAELDAAIAEAGHGDVVDQNTLDIHLDTLFAAKALRLSTPQQRSDTSLANSST